MKVKATLKQIAKNLTFLFLQFSKALNDSPEISDQTKLNLGICKENYKPNVIV
jgi:LacI family transcriptional regulator